MRFIKRVRRKAVSWLAKELAAVHQCNGGAPNCTLDATAVLYPEAEIGNFSGGPERIKIGENSHIRGRLQTYGHGGEVTIGDWCYVGVRTEIWSMDSIIIGNRVLIAHDVNIHDGSAHSMNAKERHQHYRNIIERGHPTSLEEMPGVQSAPIIIEDDVWISFGATILRGVRIGAGSVISSGAIVTRDVPPGVIYRCEISPVISSLE